MLFNSALFATAFAAVTLASTTGRPESHLEAFLEAHPNPQANVTVGRGHGIDKSVELKRGLGTAYLGNRCDHDIWVWSVDGTGSSDAIKVPARSRYSEPMRTSCDGCGVVFKVSNTDQLQDGSETQFEYAIKDNILYYDISFVNCATGYPDNLNAKQCPGHFNGVAISSPNTACGAVSCPKDQYCPTQAYYVDTPKSKLGLDEPVFGCGGAGTDIDLYFIMCNSMAPLKRSIAGRMEIDSFA